ncbi:MAG TPA: hypothetical protein VEC37_11845 [Bacillota bacterium]|nr:hypothetical protein [Bacillota bacterium]
MDDFDLREIMDNLKIIEGAMGAKNFLSVYRVVIVNKPLKLPKKCA